MTLNVARCNLGSVKIELMLVSGVRGSCATVRYTGFRRALHDTYSLCEVMQFQAPNCAFVQQFAPPLPSLLAGHGKYTG